MSKAKVQIRYDGSALSEHSIDIDDLAPALLAIGELCKLANRKFNGNNVTVKALVNVNLNQNCFEFGLELVQSLVSQVQSFVGNEDVATAKEILEWIGIISGGTATVVVGLIKLYKYVKGRKIQSTQIVTKDGKNVVQIDFEDDNESIYVDSQTFSLYQDANSLKNVKKLVAPLSKDGYEKIEFESDDGQKEEITRNEADHILSLEFQSQHLEPQCLRTWLKVHSPVYKSDAQTWKFEFLDKIATVDISETDIAVKAIERGAAFIDDLYEVKLEITQTLTSDGKIRNHYKIKEGVNFKPSPVQLSLFEIDDTDG